MSLWQSVRSFFSSFRIQVIERPCAPSKFSGPRRDAGYRDAASPDVKGFVGANEELKRWIVKIIVEAAQKRDDTLFVRFTEKTQNAFAYTSVCGDPGCRDRALGSCPCSDWNSLKQTFRECAEPYESRPTPLSNPQQYIRWDDRSDRIRAFFMIDDRRDGERAQTLGRLLDSCGCDCDDPCTDHH